jgi:hypothetical protein
MTCPEAQDLFEAYVASAVAYRFAIDALLAVVNASRAEFWSALKIAESAQNECSEALKAIDLHIVNHHCQPS